MVRSIDGRGGGLARAPTHARMMYDGQEVEASIVVNAPPAHIIIMVRPLQKRTGRHAVDDAAVHVEVAPGDVGRADEERGGDAAVDHLAADVLPEDLLDGGGRQEQGQHLSSFVVGGRVAFWVLGGQRPLAYIHACRVCALRGRRI